MPQRRSRLAGAVTAVAVLVAGAYWVYTEFLADDGGSSGGAVGEFAPFTASFTGEELVASIEALPVAEEVDDGYDRSLFPHWSDADGDGCNARHETLLAEDRSASLTEADCGADMTGQWVSMFDGVSVTEAGDLDVDHFVPLKEAWGSGAHGWSTGQREAYANSLERPWHLVAVTAASNRSKSDQDPADWLPPLEDARCLYVWAWVEVKTEWDLTVDRAERDALLEVAGGC